MSLRTTIEFITTHPLNKHRKVDAWLRFLKWQLGSRLLRGEMVHEWVDGARLLARAGETGVTGNIYCGLHEFSDMAYVLHVLSEEDVFVDVGANVGTYTVLACAVRRATGYCFEPIPSTYRRLLDNIALNNLFGRVTAFNIGLSDSEGDLPFTADENCTNHVATANDDSRSVIRVKVSTLDSTLRGVSPSVMKIDVEGLETAVLKGAHSILSEASLHSVIVELNGSGRRYGFGDQGVDDIMRGYGFSPCTYEPFSRRLAVASGGRSSQGNTLFVRNAELVRGKLARAPCFTVLGAQI